MTEVEFALKKGTELGIKLTANQMLQLRGLRAPNGNETSLTKETGSGNRHFAQTHGCHRRTFPGPIYTVHTVSLPSVH